MRSNINRPEFDSTQMPTPSHEYVCWMDIMGTGAIMPRSLETSAIFIFKLHTAAIESNDSGDVRLYPMMDGVYAVSDSKQSLLDFIEGAFSAMATDITDNIEKEYYKYVVKASIAFGPIVHGSDIPDEANDALTADYQKSILVGIPMVQAYDSEGNAPPFGVYIHESARAFSPDDETPFTHYWWEWFHRKERSHHQLAVNLSRQLSSYYEWCEQNHNSIDYEIEKIEQHRELCEEYLPEP